MTAGAGDVVVALGGEPCRLLPERALFWPATGTLVAADLHLGKGTVFRRQGIAVPAGSTAADLDRLDRLVDRLPVRRLLFLGDVFHGPQGLTPSALAPVRRWRRRHPALTVSVVAGNHDRRCGSAFDALSFAPAGPWLEEGPFRFVHDADDGGRPYRIGGHAHPGVRIAVGPGERRSFACFVVGWHRTVLPAFGSFTGVGRLAPEEGDRFFLALRDRVMEAPEGGVSRRRWRR